MQNTPERSELNIREYYPTLERSKINVRKFSHTFIDKMKELFNAHYESERSANVKFSDQFIDGLEELVTVENILQRREGYFRERYNLSHKDEKTFIRNVFNGRRDIKKGFLKKYSFIDFADEMDYMVYHTYAIEMCDDREKDILNRTIIMILKNIDIFNLKMKYLYQTPIEYEIDGLKFTLSGHESDGLIDLFIQYIDNNERISIAYIFIENEKLVITGIECIKYDVA